MVQHSAASSGELLTLAQWAEMDEDEGGELVDGFVVDEEEVGLLHEAVVAWLVWTLRSWVAPRGGFVFTSDARFGVAARRGRKPDVRHLAQRRVRSGSR